jgi:hypothetical protein
LIVLFDLLANNATNFIWANFYHNKKKEKL